MRSLPFVVGLLTIDLASVLGLSPSSSFLDGLSRPPNGESINGVNEAFPMNGNANGHTVNGHQANGHPVNGDITNGFYDVADANAAAAAASAIPTPPVSGYTNGDPNRMNTFMATNGMPPLDMSSMNGINGNSNSANHDDDDEVEEKDEEEEDNDHGHDGILVDKDLNHIFEQNIQWKREREAEDPDFFQKLGSGHHPKYMWIGCADARVPANEIMGQSAGSVFVVRNVANMVVSTDFNVMAALQFAVNVLKVDHLIVCGHYDCGGIRASVQNEDHVPPLENWLRNIRDVYRLHRDELDAIKDPEARHRRLVELNVVEQCINLFKTGAVQRRRIETYKSGQEYTTPRIHACVFDPKDGILQRLPVRSDNKNGRIDEWTDGRTERLCACASYLVCLYVYICVMFCFVLFCPRTIGPHPPLRMFMSCHCSRRLISDNTSKTYTVFMTCTPLMIKERAKHRRNQQ